MDPTEAERWSHEEPGEDRDDGPLPGLDPLHRGHTDPVSVECRQEGAAGVVAISGELALEGGDAVEVAVSQLIKDGATQVSVDARGLTFLDSSGLAGLLAARALVVDAGGTFRFGPTTEHVARVIDLAGVHDLLGPEAT